VAEKYLKPFEILYKKATVDFNAAKVLIGSFYEDDFELDLDVVMFHLQQGVEKALKAILDYNHVKFPHTHDIEELIQLIEREHIEIYELVEDLIPLSAYAVEGRYGNVHDDVDDAERYIGMLRDLLIFVKDAIS
jgi:HEPN domain-containing protein